MDYNEVWINPHVVPGFGGSRVLHFLLFSLIADKTDFIPCRAVESASVRQALDQMGDGKKDLKRKKGDEPSRTLTLARFFRKRTKWFSLIRRGVKGEMPLKMFRYTKSPVLALGDQYLPYSDLFVLCILYARHNVPSPFFTPLALPVGCIFLPLLPPLTRSEPCCTIWVSS